MSRQPTSSTLHHAGTEAMAGRNRTTGRGPSLPAGEESQIWTETYNILKQLPETHARAQKLASEANKTQRVLLALGNGEGLHQNDLG